MDWSERAFEVIWIGGLAAVPVALAAAVCCRFRGARPATRHAVWFAVLATFVAPVLTTSLWRPAWFRSERVLAAADSLVQRSRPAPNVERAKTAPARAKSFEPVRETAAPLGANSASMNMLERWCEPVPVVEHSGGISTAPFVHDSAPERPRLTPLLSPPVRLDPGVASSPARAAPMVALPSVGEAKSRPVLPVHPSAEPVQSSPVSIVPAPTTLPSASIANERVGWTSEVRAWTGYLLAVRDAAAAAPPIPPVVWLGGTGLAAALLGVRIVRVRRVVQRGEPAPSGLIASVERVARLAGLRRAPRVLFVPDRVSPMIWCGLRPTLVLPRALWQELDPTSRRAVIAHELAHLRRRDHRLFWLEACIGLVYWWHPVAWWARRRLHDEAEACCDAWVTTLMPDGRRAYAEALIATKSFLSVPGLRGAPGLAVMNGRTRLLARRLTMVMTQRVAPRASVMGMALALSIGAAGTFVMPSLACPPDEKEQAKTVAKAEAAAVKAQARAAKDEVKRAEKAAKAAKERAQKDGVQFFGEAPALESMRRGGSAGGDEAAVNRALQEKERALRQLERRLQDMQRRLENMQRAPRSSGGRSGVDVWRAAPAASGDPLAPRAVVVMPRYAPDGRVSTPSTPLAVVAPDAYVLRPAPSAGVAVAGQDDAREYNLPEGKLEALAALMARDDVPILIERRDNGIVVHATPEQHRVFEAFVIMINPDGGGRGMAPADATDSTPEPDEARAIRIYGQQLRAETERFRDAINGLSVARVDAMTQSEAFQKEIEAARGLGEAVDDESADEDADDEGDCDDAGAACDEVEGCESTDLPCAEEVEVDPFGLVAFPGGLSRMEAQIAAMEELTGRLEVRLEEITAALASLGDSGATAAASDHAVGVFGASAAAGVQAGVAVPSEAAAPTPAVAPVSGATAMPAQPDAFGKAAR